MKRFTMFLGLGIMFLVSLAPIESEGAAVPQLINFQGILRDGSGNPVADAVYVIRFRIYDDSTTGANLWEEFDDVQTTDGLFNVRLGDTTDLPDGLFEGSVNRFVGVKVGGDPEAAPRTRLISVPYAFHALRSDSAATATVALDLTCAGCVDAADLAANSVGADEIASGAVGTSEIDATQVQRRVTGTAGANQYITGINQDGSVVTAGDQVGTASGWTDDGAVVRLSTGTDNVGIGTTSPQFGARLEVVDRVNVIGAGTSRVFIAKDGDEYLEASYNAASSRGQISTFNSSQSLILQQTGGNVGIGTISPGSRLQVEGQVSSSVTGAAAPGFTFTGDLNTGLFETVPDELGLATNGVDRLHITSGGSVGIGTTSPTKKLDVAGSIKVGTNDTVFSSNISSNSPLALQAPAGTTRMYIDDVSGNVGLGTAAPSRNLHIFQDVNNSVGLRIENPNVGGAAQERIDFGTGSAHIRVSGASNGMSIVNNRTAGTVEFEVGGTQRLFISNSGNVGIGTNGPSNKLDVEGGAAIGASYSGTFAAPANGLLVEGIVGIGTTTPQNKLDVEGGAVIGAAYSGTSVAPVNGLLVEGNVGIGTTATEAKLHAVSAELGAANPVAIFDRSSSDGTIIYFRQAGITEGTISVSGVTVSYNAFTGSHYGWTDEKLERGELVALTGINRNSHDNPKSEIIYGIKRSGVSNDPACLGSYLALAEPSKPAGTENPHLVMAVGNGDMWVVDEGQNIQPGDYLISSSTPGHAMKDDEEKYPIGHIVARAAEGVDWSTVSEMTGGSKHKKISVLFGNFVRSNPSTVAQTLEGLQEIILKQQKEIEELKNIVLKEGSSVMAETKR